MVIWKVFKIKSIHNWLNYKYHVQVWRGYLARTLLKIVQLARSSSYMYIYFTSKMKKVNRNTVYREILALFYLRSFRRRQQWANLRLNEFKTIFKLLYISNCAWANSNGTKLFEEYQARKKNPLAKIILYKYCIPNDCR